MSSKEHIQLGWVIRWVLSTPPGHPTAGRCVRVVPVPPLLLCTLPARARPSIGGQSPTPAPRQLPWSPPRGWRTGRLAHPTFCSLTFRRSRSQNEIERNNAPRRRGAAVVEPRYALWGRAMHPGPCGDSLHLPQKLCRGSPNPPNDGARRPAYATPKTETTNPCQCSDATVTRRIVAGDHGSKSAMMSSSMSSTVNTPSVGNSAV
jgi:hypothetical protein